MGRAIWVSHTTDLDWNTVVGRLPEDVADGEERLVIAELQDNCLVLRALSAHRYRIRWRARRFGGDGQLVVYPHPKRSRRTKLDLRLNCPTGLLIRRRRHLLAIGGRLMTRLAAVLEEHENAKPLDIALDDLPATSRALEPS